jgi:hypothetical protein
MKPDECRVELVDRLDSTRKSREHSAGDSYARQVELRQVWPTEPKMQNRGIRSFYLFIPRRPSTTQIGNNNKTTKISNSSSRIGDGVGGDIVHIDRLSNRGLRSDC